jgi:two-component system phosphate regulon sensor histidine kinase PhoR
MILIKVQDRGFGNELKKSFRSFIENTLVIYTMKGHGLGLAYVKRIVEDHHGVCHEKGKGSTFIIKLPNNLKYHKIYYGKYK